MRFLFDLKVEIGRICRERFAWGIVVLTLLCPIAGYSLYQPTSISTIGGFALVNPVLTAGLGGGILFAMLTLYQFDRLYRSRMDALMESMVTPVYLNVIKMVSILLVALAVIIIMSAVYLPYTAYRMGALFDFTEYVKSFFILALPSLWMAILASVSCYQLFRRVDLSFVLLVALISFSLGKWTSSEYILRWINPLVPKFSDDFGNEVVFRTAGYNRLFWFSLFIGLWLASWLAVRNHQKGLVGSFLHNVRRFYILILSLVFFGIGGYLYTTEPYVDHSSPIQLAGAETAGQTVSIVQSSPYAEVNNSLVLLNTTLETFIDPPNSRLSSKSMYTLKNRSGLPQESILQINPGYSIEHVVANGIPLNYVDKKNDHNGIKDITIQLPADSDIILEVSYSGAPKIWSELRSQLSGGSIEEDYIDLGGLELRPLINAVAEGAGLIGEITLPKNLEVITTGKQALFLRENTDGTKTWQVEDQSGGISLFAGEYVKLKLEGTETPIYFYYSQKHQKQMEELNIKSFLEETLNYCTNNYGSLPFTKEEPLNIVVSSTHRFGGGLIRNLSIMNESRFGEAGFSNSRRAEINAEAISTGIIQQWWGQGAQLMDAKNPYWTSEGVTTYTYYRMMKEKNGEEYAQKNHVDVWTEAWVQLNRNFYNRNPHYQSILPKKYLSELQDQFGSINTHAVMALKIYKATQLIGEGKMDAILTDLYKNGGKEFPPFVTWHDFLNACGLTEEELSLGENI